VKINEAVIRHSYEQTANRLARLSLFAEKGEAEGYSYEVTFRQEQLATDDIINVSIACRRLVDALGLREKSLGRDVLALSPIVQWAPATPRPTNLSLHETLNKIIHSSYIEIFGFTFQLQPTASAEDAYKIVLEKEKFRIPPLLAVKSDRGPLTLCDLKDLCNAIDDILDAASEAASERSIYLGEF
tara:strand:- start:2941 stop:3498 length:558 start_codon:yes stop_codon:yes gene_type:complete